MKLLALDTASDACSAAVLTSEGCFSVFEMTPRAHTQLILPMIDSVLQQAGLCLSDLDALAFGRGPGAFTGVRIATGVVQGLALAADKPVLGVSTLAALAQQAFECEGSKQALVGLDARMGEVYWGVYQLQDGRMQLQGEEQVLNPSAVTLPNALQLSNQAAEWIGVGSAWAIYTETLRQACAPVVNITTLKSDYLPNATYIASLACFDWALGLAVPAEQAQPIYLRNKVAQTTLERASLSG